MKSPIIYLVTVCRDEEEILPHFFRYYSAFITHFFVYLNTASRDSSAELIDNQSNATKINYDTKGLLRDDLNMLIKNSVWQEWTLEADWIIAVDNDEFIYHPKGVLTYLEHCDKQGITIPLTIGYDMISDIFPTGNEDILEMINFGAKNERFSKPAVFNCKKITQINYTPGGHRCDPKGAVKFSIKRELLLLHYKYIGGLSRLKRRWNEVGDHLSQINRDNNWGIERTRPYEILKRYNRTWRDRQKVIGEKMEFHSKNIEIVEGLYNGISYRFAITHAQDHIQQFHKKGQFYEIQELELSRLYIPENANLLDCGANIGNHILFYSLACHAFKVTYIEPNPIALKTLDLNLSLNRIYERTLIEPYRNIALSDRTSFGDISYHSSNIGGAVINYSNKGSIKVVRGDDLFETDKFDFIKIDTEDQDLEALTGLEEVILRSQCPVFVEILDTKFKFFLSKIFDWGYKVDRTMKTYPKRTNYIIVPKSYNKKG